MQEKKASLKYNASGYYDPTAYIALKECMKQPKHVHKLITLLKNIAEDHGFEIVGRIELKDKKTGRIYR